MSAFLPLHLLPPHIKLQILSKLQVPPIHPAALPSTSAVSTSPSSTTSSPPSALFTSPPLFPLTALSTSTPLPSPFTSSALTHLHTQGYCVIDGFLTHPSLPPTFTSTLSTCLTSLLSASAFHPGSMQASQSWSDPALRGDLVYWLPSPSPPSVSPVPAIPPPITALLALLHSSVQSLAAVLPSFPCAAASSQLAVYPAGGRYVRHRDTKEGGPVRRLTAIVYLNEGWKEDWGGQLRLWVRKEAEVEGGEEGVAEEAVDVWPTYGRLLLFQSAEMEHEVLPTTHQRAALTSWFK